MRMLVLLLLCLGCAHTQESSPAPSWVTAIRTGEEALRVSQGSKIFFRRIAGGPQHSQETSCELVIMKAQEDIRKEFQTQEISHTVEVLYYDSAYRDCAVTISVDPKQREMASLSKSEEELSEEEASRLLLERSEKAIRFALTGLTLEEFERFSQEKVSINSGNSLCQTFFQTQQYSIHGLTHVCWTNQNILGYCMSRTKQCWVRTPN